MLGHHSIGSEHILLGLLRESEGLAARALDSLGITAEDVRARIVRIVGRREIFSTAQMPFTPHAKRVLELSLREGNLAGHNYVGTEHILLGLAREGEGLASQILADCGSDGEALRNAIIRLLSGADVEVEARELAPFVPESPPFAPEFGAELLRLRSEREQAAERQELELAARLRERERRLSSEARALQRAWAMHEGDAPLEGERESTEG